MHVYECANVSTAARLRASFNTARSCLELKRHGVQRPGERDRHAVVESSANRWRGRGKGVRGMSKGDGSGRGREGSRGRAGKKGRLRWGRG